MLPLAPLSEPRLVLRSALQSVPLSELPLVLRSALQSVPLSELPLVLRSALQSVPLSELRWCSRWLRIASVDSGYRKVHFYRVYGLIIYIVEICFVICIFNGYIVDMSVGPYVDE